MSSELNRATLERKDKDELTQIAAAMGGKPGSRARKADIVDLVMELAGVSDETPVEPEPDMSEADPTADSAQGYSADPMDDARAEANGEPPPQPDTSGAGQDRQSQPSQSGAEPGNRKRRRRGRSRERGDGGGGEEWNGEPVEVEGYLDLRDDGYGFLRVNGLLPSKEDVYVSVKQVRQFGLRKGDHLAGAGRPAGRSEKNPALIRIDSVNGREPEQAINRAEFDDLTAVFVDTRLELAGGDESADLTGRAIDILVPLGKGQRGLVVAPPGTGKTTIMKDMARAIQALHPEVEMLALLVAERPEEVTEMQRWFGAGEVVASTFDRPAEEHCAVAELTLERAKRMVEMGKDVFILLDGITSLVRAYNMSSSSGRVTSDALDAAALYPPKNFFGAARNVEEGGSLTIVASVLVETGSSTDDLIFDEFQGTSNWELRLDRGAAESRTYPAIDVRRSSTRHEELLLDGPGLEQAWALRRALAAKDSSENPFGGLEFLVEGLRASDDNAAYLSNFAGEPVGS